MPSMISRGALAGFICKPVQSLATLNGAFDFVRMSQTGVNSQQINTTYHLILTHIDHTHIYIYAHQLHIHLPEFSGVNKFWSLEKGPLLLSKIAESNSICRGKTAQIFHMPYPGGRWRAPVIWTKEIKMRNQWTNGNKEPIVLINIGLKVSNFLFHLTLTT